MATEKEAQTLTSFEVTSDGTSVRLNAKSSEEGPLSVILSSECLRQLVMTLPRIARETLRRRHRDNNLRIVYPMADWLIEKCADQPDTVIVTMNTPDGYEVSFALSTAKTRDFANSMSAAMRDEPSSPRLVN